MLLNIKIQKQTEIYRALYPKLPPTADAGKLSLTKTTEIEKDIATEAEHYRLVATKIFMCPSPVAINATF